MTISKASKFYLERAGILMTERGPRAHLSPTLNAVHFYPLKPPLPNPVFLQDENGNPSPDRASTRIWPSVID